MTDHAEGQITAVSWLVQMGKSLYHELDTPERYSLIYGPMLYLIHGFSLKLFGANIVAAKLPSSLALVLSLIFIFFILKVTSNLKTSLLGSAYFTLTILCFGNAYGNVIFHIRSDSLILMCVSLGLLSVVISNRWLAPFLCALVLSLSINLKITSILYFFPLYMLLYIRHGTYITLGAFSGAIVLTFAPFVLSEISLQNYVIWIQRVSHHGVSIQQLQQNMIAALYLLVPLGIVTSHLLLTEPQEFRKILKQERNYVCVLFLSK